MKTSIVILNWNGAKYLEMFLPSVIEHSTLPNVEIVVADNASTDNSIEILSQKFPTVKIIRLDKNYGFAEGYNRALNLIDAEYFVLLNSDVEVTNNWIQPIVEMMDADDRIAACQPKLCWYDNKPMFEYAGAAGGFIDKLGYPFCRGRIFSDVEVDAGQYDDATEIFWATGACMFVRAGCFKKAGGLDGDFFAHMEEIDLCWRLKGMGYKIMYNPHSVVYHVGGGTLPKTNPFKTYLNFRNNISLLFKNSFEGSLGLLLFKRMLLDGVAALRFVAAGEFGNFRAVFRAHIYLYANFKTMARKRNDNKKLFVTTHHKEIYNGSIVLDYFLRKKKSFGDFRF